MQFPATGIAGRPQPGAVANEPDPLVGKKVWTKWPEDNNFYEAVITDYKAAEVSYLTNIYTHTHIYISILVPDLHFLILYIFSFVKY